MYRIIFSFGPFSIYSYGLMLAIGFLVALWFAQRRAKNLKLDANKIADLCFYLIVAGILGARILYVLLNWRYFRENLFDILKVWEGGLVYYGGLILGFFVYIWFVWKNKLSFAKIADLMSVPLSVGIFFGRIGCFLNGCCYGNISKTWGISFPAKDIPPVFAQQVADGLIKPGAVCSLPVIPTQLYAALHGLIIFLVLIWLERKERKPWFSFLVFVLLYAIGRFFLENFRFYEGQYLFLRLSISQWISLFIALIALMFILLRKKQEKTKVS